MYDRAFCHFLLRTFDKRWSNENIFRLATDILAGLSFLFFAGNDKRDSRERERERDSSSLACRSKTTGKEDCIVSDDNNKQAREFH